MFDARFFHGLSQLLENLIGWRKFYCHVSGPRRRAIWRSNTCASLFFIGMEQLPAELAPHLPQIL
jgi:hypothetical protein